MAKVALVGTHCSGKTTLLKELVRVLRESGVDNFVYGGEVSRECPYALNRDANFLTQWFCLSRQIELESNLSREADNILVDRSVFDVMTYTWRQQIHGMISMDEYLLIVETGRSWARWFPYDALIYLSPLPEIEDDGVRDTDPEYQAEIDRLTLISLRYDVPERTSVLYINDPSIKERVSRSVELVSKLFT